MSAGPIARLRRLGRERRRMLVTATVLLSRASLTLALVPFRSAIRFGCVPVGRAKLADAEDVIWAVEAAARRLPWRIVCIQKGLAAQRMLRAAGMDAILHYGMRSLQESDSLEAHVWVTVGEEAVIGGEEADGFVAVTTYPASRIVKP